MSAGGTMENWRGDAVGVAYSPSGVMLLCDYADNLIATDFAPWPPPALVAKLVADDRVASRWPEDLREAVSGRLGHYCPLQSINSEDAVTWSALGALMYGPPQLRTDALNWILAELDLAADNERCAIDLWRRIPHPQKPSAPGPELDVLFDGDRTVVYVEAKWGSGEGTGQGPARDATQMQLRRDFLERYGRRIYGNRRFVVLGLVVSDAIEAAPPPDTEHVVTRTMRWEDLAEMPGHPAGGELAAYVAWKRKHTGR